MTPLWQWRLQLLVLQAIELLSPPGVAGEEVGHVLQRV